jgi:hypothetical protein
MRVHLDRPGACAALPNADAEAGGSGDAVVAEGAERAA